MDYIEIMNFCGYDMDKAHEMAMRHGVIPFSDAVKAAQKSEKMKEEVPCISIITLIPSEVEVMVLVIAL